MGSDSTEKAVAVGHESSDARLPERQSTRVRCVPVAVHRSSIR
ncbi:hypothetical protein HSR121_0882 [Halapricum desulfuricans]|uniref:Uncharacterized protein n=1 Tax=Halapricum desulfuricans TaxID=2841257 RepID=A0A897MX95_9EURY|nr:hypothetical protein HSR121_0882 [Halapricum desulfuricans]